MPYKSVEDTVVLKLRCVILEMVHIWPVTFDRLIIRILSLYIEFKDAKNLYIVGDLVEAVEDS